MNQSDCLLYLVTNSDHLAREPFLRVKMCIRDSYSTAPWKTSKKMGEPARATKRGQRARRSGWPPII